MQVMSIKLLVPVPVLNILQVISFNQDNDPMMYRLLLFPHCNRGESGLEKWNNLPWVTACIQTRVRKAFTHNLSITCPMW